MVRKPAFSIPAQKQGKNFNRSKTGKIYLVMIVRTNNVRF